MRRFTVYIGTLAFMLLSCNSEPAKTKVSQAKSEVKKTEVAHKSTEKAKEKNIKTVIGVDVSHFQGDVNWEELKSDGVLFAYAKATQGAYYTDPMYSTNWKNMDANNMYKGAYHFFVYNDEAEAQANHFIKTVSYTKQDLPPVLDLEGGGVEGKVDVKNYQSSVLKWLQMVEKSIGIKPVIYTNVSFGNTYLNAPEFANYKLWLAEYTKEQPELPITWQKEGWTIWQRAQTGVIKGINGNVDHDLFNGDFNAFKELLKTD